MKDDYYCAACQLLFHSNARTIEVPCPNCGGVAKRNAYYVCGHCNREIVAAGLFEESRRKPTTKCPTCGRRAQRVTILGLDPPPPERKTEVRSNYEQPQVGQLPSVTSPCTAPEGYSWVHSFSRSKPSDLLQVGKWLIRVGCKHVDYCRGAVRDATEAGTLGIAAKVATDWGNANDPAGPWKEHVICIYTADWRDQEDVMRVATRLKEIDAVRKQPLYYKPDAMTYGGVYSGNSPGGVAVYAVKPPYLKLVVHQENIVEAKALASEIKSASGKRRTVEIVRLPTDKPERRG